MTFPDAPRIDVTGKTRVMFIIGDPVDHILGTRILNAAWAEQGRDLITVPLHVPPENLAHALDMIRKYPNIAGTGITIPHKIAATDLVDHLTDAAAHAGAVNFIRRNDDASLTGHNVDGTGFLSGLLSHGVDPAGRSIALAGAGGVARAIAFALAGAGADALFIRNRDHLKAQALAAEIRGWKGAAGCTVTAGRPSGNADILVNATSLGMRETDPLPFDRAEIRAGIVTAEVVMTPAITPFMAEAARKGGTIVPGRAMMDPQAALVAQFLDGNPA